MTTFTVRPSSSRVAGFACGLWVIFALAACSVQAPQELVAISPELEMQRTDTAISAGDVAQATDVAPIVLAMLNNQASIAGAAERVRSRFATVEVQRSGFYPQISAGVGSNLVGNASATPQLRLTGSQLLYDFGRTGRGVSREVLLAQKAHLDFLEVVDDDLTELLRLLVEYDSQSEQVSLARERLARMRELRRLVENQIVEGATTGSSLIEAERRVQTAETLLLRTVLAQASNRRAIQAETGVAIAAAAPSMNFDNLSCGATPFDAGLVAAVRMAQVDIAVAQLDLKTARTARLPSISLEAASNQDFSNLSDTSNVGVNVSVDTTVFNGGAVQSRNAAAVRNAAAAEATFNGEQQRALRSFENAQDAVRSQMVLADALRDQSALLDETRTLYLQQFVELGTKTLDDVLDVEEEYHQNLLDIAVARQDAKQEQLTCLAAQGLPRRFVGVDDTLLYGLALGP